MTLFIRSIKLAVFQLYITRITSHSNALFHIKKISHECMEQIKPHDQLTMYIHLTESKMLIFTYMYTLFGGVYTSLETEKTYRRSNRAVRVFMVLKKNNMFLQ